MKHGPHHDHKHFYGTVTIGDKGQVVIPADARKAMGLKTGQKLLVIGMGKSMITLTKSDQLEKMADALSKKLEGIRDVLKKV
jgi:AbrB family looped-hinge helix DNA binding protein